MKRLPRSLVVVAVAVGFFDTQGCTSACIRHTDCGNNEQCITGACMVVVAATGDGSTVGTMTPPPSSTAMPTATSTTPVPSSSAPDHFAPPTDAGSTSPPSPLDASFDGYTF
jgi:hypothetical protein